ncbi:MAG: cohesin domain-containing protein, partial [Bacteroidota bacterium]
MKFLQFIVLLVISFLLSADLSAQVKAYGQKGFAGKGVELKPGKYVYAQLQKRGLGTLEGLRVPKGCDVKVYPSANMQGEAKRFAKNNGVINKSGAYSLKVACGSVGAQPGFAIGASDEVGRKGDLIYVDVNISDFEKIVSMQYSMNWDPTVLQFEKIQNTNLKDLSNENFGLKEVAKGNLLMAWYDQSVQGVTLPDGTNIYQVVFRVIGDNA